MSPKNRPKAHRKADERLEGRAHANVAAGIRYMTVSDVETSNIE